MIKNNLESNLIKSKGKRFALFTGILAFSLVAGSIFIFRDKIVENYHLYRLRSNPDYSYTIIDKPKQSPERKALYRFFRDNDIIEKNKELLFRSYLFEFLDLLGEFRFDVTSGHYEKVLIGLNKSGAWRRGYSWKSSGVSGGYEDSRHLERLQYLQTRIKILNGKTFSIREYSNWRFSILAGNKAFQKSGLTEGSGKTPIRTEYYCLAERIK